MTARIDLSSKSFRVSMGTVVIFLGIAAVWVVTDGWTSSDGSSWLWPVSTTPGFLASDHQLFKQELERAWALAESEARILNETTARLAALLRLQEGSGGDRTVTNSEDTTSTGDVTPVLRLLNPEDPQARRLSKLRYCTRFQGSQREPVQFLDPWLPSGKFLLPLCYSGQISNRLVCMRAYLLFAVLLNRTLIIPELETGRLGYMYSLVIDVSHARRCIGDEANRTIISLGEYRAMIAAPDEPDARKVKVAVDKLLCWKEDCETTPLRHSIWGDQASDVILPSTDIQTLGPKVKSVQDLQQVYGTVPDRLITMGDLYGVKSLDGLPLGLGNRPTFPLPGMSCNLFLQPHPAIVQAAKAFVRTVLGPDFLAVHLRRGDFHGYWNRAECRNMGDANRFCRIRPIYLIARCIVEKARGTNISVVFAATNALPVELSLLHSLLASSHPPVALVTLPGSFTEQPFRWAATWRRLKFDAQPLAFATMDKLVCAMGKIFMGTRGSTFTDDIATMRAALGTLTCEDQDVCALFQYSSDPLPFFNETDIESKLMFRK